MQKPKKLWEVKLLGLKMYLKQQITRDTVAGVSLYANPTISYLLTHSADWHFNELVFNLFTLNWVDRRGRLNSHLFSQGDIAFRVHLVLRVACTGSFAGTKFHINIHLKEEIKFFLKKMWNSRVKKIVKLACKKVLNICEQIQILPL